MEGTTIKQGNSKGAATSYFFPLSFSFVVFSSRIYDLLSINLSKISGNKFAGVYYINILPRRPHSVFNHLLKTYHTFTAKIQSHILIAVWCDIQIRLTSNVKPVVKEPKEALDIGNLDQIAADLADQINESEGLITMK